MDQVQRGDGDQCKTVWWHVFCPFSDLWFCCGCSCGRKAIREGYRKHLYLNFRSWPPQLHIPLQFPSAPRSFSEGLLKTLSSQCGGEGGDSSHLPGSSPVASCPHRHLLWEQPCSSLLHTWRAQSSKIRLLILETTLQRSQSGSCLSKGSFVLSEGFPLCPRGGGWAVPGIFGVFLIPSHGTTAV